MARGPPSSPQAQHSCLGLPYPFLQKMVGRISRGRLLYRVTSALYMFNEEHGDGREAPPPSRPRSPGQHPSSAAPTGTAVVEDAAFGHEKTSSASSPLGEETKNRRESSQQEVWTSQASSSDGCNVTTREEARPPCCMDGEGSSASLLGSRDSLNDDDATVKRDSSCRLRVEEEAAPHEPGSSPLQIQKGDTSVAHASVDTTRNPLFD